VGGTPLPQLLALVVLALGLLSLGAYLLLRPRWQERMEGAEDPAEAEALLAKMAAAALAVPAAWRGTTELMRHRLLPRVGGKRVSIARAERLGREGRLFIGSGSRRLAALAGSRGACVLDREGRLFRTLMEGMSGAVDLDEVEGLGCVLPGSADEPALLRHANRVLAGRCGSRVALVAARASVQELRDVDLRNARLPRACGWPGQLVALGTSSAFLAGCAREHRVQPQIAVFKLLDRVTGESWLLRPDASRIRYLAACALIEEGSA
jgi:hypothetical protein